jgi:hypothetical protein
MDRRKAELQLRLVQAMLHAELKRGEPGSLVHFLDAAFPIVNQVAIAVSDDADSELSRLMDKVRSELRAAERGESVAHREGREST